MTRLKFIILLSLLLGIFGAVDCTRAAGTVEIAVVVHRDVPVDNLTFAELRKIVLGDRQFWASNLKVTLLIRTPVSHERDVLLKNVLQMSEAQFRQYWIGKVFRAESAAAPKAVPSNEIALSLVNTVPGSIAFVTAAEVPKDLKVIRIGGLAPGDKGYPLN